MTTQERIKQEAANWIEAIPKPNEFNRMYGHHLTSFEAGALSERNKVIEEVKLLLDKHYNPPFNENIKQALESLKV